MFLFSRATPLNVIGLYKFYLNLERDSVARLYYRFLPTYTLKNKIFTLLYLVFNLLLPRIGIRKTIFYLAINNKNIVGVCHITVYSLKPQTSSIKNYGVYGIIISKNARGKGLGKILSLYAIMDAWERFDLKKIYLTVDTDNTKAIKLYRELSFKIISRVPSYDYRYLTNSKVDGYIMGLTLY
ncbi:MAG: GNAT family N-acetyltransferase [Desulfurococcales archaeon]|nr:GNAT family N-acetyltransferase [Desulfurococcales archaeon]